MEARIYNTAFSFVHQNWSFAVSAQRVTSVNEASACEWQVLSRVQITQQTSRAGLVTGSTAEL